MANKRKKSDQQLEAFSKLTRQWLLTAPVEGMTEVELAGAFLQLDMILKMAKDRKEEVRARCLELLPQIGDENDKGSFSFEVDGTTLIQERRVEKLPNADAVKEQLREREMDISEAFSEVRTWKLDPSKVQFLVECGKLDGEVLDRTKKVTWAVKVKPSGAIKDFIDKTKAALTKNAKKK